MFEIKVIEKTKTHTLCSIYFFFKENRTVYKILWKNTVLPSRPRITIRRTRIACWIPTTTDRRHIAYCFFTATMVARSRIIVTLYVHYLYCFTRSRSPYICGHNLIFFANPKQLLSLTDFVEFWYPFCRNAISIPLQQSIFLYAKWRKQCQTHNLLQLGRQFV